MICSIYTMNLKWEGTSCYWWYFEVTRGDHLLYLENVEISSNSKMVWETGNQGNVMEREFYSYVKLKYKDFCLSARSSG